MDCAPRNKTHPLKCLLPLLTVFELGARTHISLVPCAAKLSQNRKNFYSLSFDFRGVRGGGNILSARIPRILPHQKRERQALVTGRYHLKSFTETAKHIKFEH